MSYIIRDTTYKITGCQANSIISKQLTKLSWSEAGNAFDLCAQMREAGIIEQKGNFFEG